MLAYYESADGIRLLAPRGWNCQGAWGSEGGRLFLSPEPIPDTRSGFEGAAIEIDHFTSEASGRYDVAETVARVFPDYKASAIRTLQDMELPVPSGPYPTDTLRYRGKRIVEYETPAQTEGLGTFKSWLKRNDSPIVGAAILILHPPNLIGFPPNVVLLSMRLPPDLARLAPTIVGYVERDYGDLPK